MTILRTLCLFGAVLVTACQSPQPRQESPPAAPVQAAQNPASAAERARAHTELGASYLHIGRFAVALQELNEALKADPRYVPAHNTLGLVYMELREDDKARASFERALKIDPNDSDTNNNYGLFLCDRKREKDSIRYFLAALKNPLYTTPQDAFVNAGICSRRAGDSVAAQSYFERALAVAPTDERAMISLAQLHFGQRQYNLAKTYLTRYMQRVQNADASSLWLGARIENQLGDRAALMSYGSQLKSRHPESPETKAFLEGRFE
ncbi:MAG: type IV pilus biogenesis/stability protein PilW [Burkholderiales bacterium]